MEIETQTENWWVNDIKNWDKIGKDSASLMLAQSEKLLSETIDTAKLIAAKSNQLITIIISLSTLVTGYLCANLLTHGLDFLSLSSIFSLILLSVGGFYTYKNFRPYQIHVLGDYPHNIVTSKYIDNEFDSNQQYLNLLLNICDNLENRIGLNDRFNIMSTKNNERAIKALCIIPICPVLSYLSLVVLSHLHF